MEILIENVRCFHGKHKVPIKPITLLVGENSSGKSTFLAVLSVLANSTEFPFVANFNTPPFDLGNYENIASRKSSRSKPSASFKIGFEEIDDNQRRRETFATYRGSSGQIILSDFTVIDNEESLHLEIKEREGSGNLVLLEPKSSNKTTVPFQFRLFERERGPSRSGLFESVIAGSDLINQLSESAGRQQKNLHFKRLLDILRKSSFPAKNIISLAPVRTKPRRTYDQFNAEFKPEGDHVPVKLALLYESDASQDIDLRSTVRTSMEKFGRESGLFDKVDIVRFGDEPGAPFRVAVHQDGLEINLIDVGYGVSQSLPIIVESLIAKPNGMLLMQQPEVHLHPRAQAALGSFFADLAATKRMHFAIETHSDYLIDRVRQEVASGTIKPDLVTILFFEKKNGKSNIYPISIDEEGNVVDAPPTYRDFFLEEEFRLLTRG